MALIARTLSKNAFIQDVAVDLLDAGVCLLIWRCVECGLPLRLWECLEAK